MRELPASAYAGAVTADNRYCVYVDWLARHAGDEVLGQIDDEIIPDDEASETCIYWDETRSDVLVISWNLDAASESSARDLARGAVTTAVGALVPGRPGAITVYPLEDDDMPTAD